MGAWSHEPFGNDDAGDWVSELSNSNDFSKIESALNSVTDEAADYLEAPECSAALAAAEVVAALLGKPTKSLDEDAAAWVANKPRPTPELVSKATRAVSSVLESSELQELWAESEDYAQWQFVTNDLLARLS
ncbi:MAG: DUF4259 domain-containing protein [Rudaea sp.]|nr:DUF4259 domain-containing protein [Rudaea sp.]